MKQVFLSTTTEFKEIETLEPGSWINLVNPSQSESMEIASAFNIDIADLRAPLDAEEMSRMTIEDEYTLIIVDVPIKEERNNQTYYVTIPLGDYPDRRGYYHDLLGEIATSRYLYQPTLAEFLYLYAVALYLSDPLSQRRTLLVCASYLGSKKRTD